MKKIRIFCSKWYVTGTVIFSILFYSCKKDTQSSLNDLDGKAIFKGIYFGEGKAAQAIAQFVPNFKDWVPESDRGILTGIENEFVSKIEKKYPGFFENFEREVRSNDLAKVKAALVNAGKALKEIVKTNEDLGLNVNEEGEAELVRQIEADAVKKMNKEQVAAIFKTKRYRQMLQKAFGVEMSSDESINSMSQDNQEGSVKDINRNYHRGVETYVYVAIVLVIVAAIAAVLAAVIPEEDPTIDPDPALGGTNADINLDEALMPDIDPGDSPELTSLRINEFLATVTTTFAK